MTYLSVCSGIEAASVAWEPLGWQAIGFAEIEPFPCEVLRQKYPAVKNYGDITQYEKWDGIGQFGALVGGTPCQSFSVAGKRGGTNDIRGQLMYAYLGIVEKYKPRWILWENVPGVLSSGKGLDFASFLAGLEQCGYGWAYRVLDAQYFGVPQRRRRVFVVGHIGNRTDLAAKVLFDGISVQGDIAAGENSRENTPDEVARSTGSTVYLTHPQDSRYTVTAQYGTGGGNTPLVVNGRQYPIVCKDLAQTVDNFSHTNVVAFCENSFGGYKEGIGTLKASGGTLGGGSETFLKYRTTLRRLTPLECERLQGFPDNWTRIEWRGKPAEQCPDSHRYKAIGNSMAVPVMRWIGKRIENFNERVNKCLN